MQVANILPADEVMVELRYTELPVQMSSANDVLPSLWARHKIARLSDDENLVADEASCQAIKALGLKYKLLTKTTEKAGLYFFSVVLSNAQARHFMV